MRARRKSFTILVVAILFVVVPRRSESARTDILILDNGDTITGEILSLQRGKLSFKTDNIGTLSVEWTHVAGLKSTNYFTFEDQRGVLHFGSLAEASEYQLNVVVGKETVATLDIDSVVNIYRIKPNLWSRLDGSLDIGYTYTQQNGATQYNLNTSVRETTEKQQVQIAFSSLFSTQDDAATTTRNSLGGTYYRHIDEKWFYLGTAGFAQNNGLDLDLRSIFGGGVGRELYQTNSDVLLLFGGLDYNRELYSDSDDPVSSLEAIGGVEYAHYTFDGLTSDFTTSFLVLPSLTDTGRVRLQWNTNLRQNIVGDLYWNLNLLEEYDSRPPQSDAANNDFSISTSLGWTF
jgi:hypothetical protein